MADECAVCAEVKPDLVTCPCGFTACKDCSEKWMLQQNTQASCCQCGKAWDRAFLYNNFGSEFLCTKYDPFFDDIVLKRELGLMHEVMPVVEWMSSKKKFEQTRKQIAKTEMTLSAMMSVASRKVTADSDFETSSSHLRNTSIKHAMYAAELRHCNNMIRFINKRIQSSGDRDQRKPKTSRFVFKCPVTTCRGMLNERFVCAVCLGEACPKCHEPTTCSSPGGNGNPEGNGNSEGNGNDESSTNVPRNSHDSGSNTGSGSSSSCCGEHICDAKKIESIQLIMRTSRQCPACHEAIFRTDGCNVMFCTRCFTGFDWSTLEVIKGPIHNVHYLQHIQSNPDWQPTPAAACDGTPLSQDRSLVVKYNALGKPEVFNRFLGLEQLRRHILGHEVQLGSWDTVKLNRESRIGLALGKIDTAKFKAEVTRRYKHVEYKRQVADVWQTTASSISDLVARFLQVDRHDYQALVCEVNTLVEYSNKCMADLGKVYACGHRAIEMNYPFSAQPYHVVAVSQKQHHSGKRARIE